MRTKVDPNGAGTTGCGSTVGACLGCDRRCFRPIVNDPARARWVRFAKIFYFYFLFFLPRVTPPSRFGEMGNLTLTASFR